MVVCTDKSEARQTDSEFVSTSEAGDRPLDDVLACIEKREIMAALEKADGQRTLAARMLKISRSRLYRRMEALGINPRLAQSQALA